MNATDQLLTTEQLAHATGLTYRQIDYWTRAGAIETTIWTSEHPPRRLNAAGGQGTRRRYQPAIVDPLRIVATLTRLFPGGISTAIVRAIVDNHHAGQVDLGDGIRLSWRADPPAGFAHEWTGPNYLTDAECDRLLAALEAET